MPRRDEDVVVHSGHHFESMFFPRAAKERRNEREGAPSRAGAERASEGLQRTGVAAAIRRAASPGARA